MTNPTHPKNVLRDWLLGDADAKAAASLGVAPGKHVEWNADELDREEVLETGMGNAMLKYTNAWRLIREGSKQRGQHKRAGAANTGQRASRYAAQHPEWLTAAQQACTGLKGSKAVRQSAAKDAILRIAKRASKRTVARFVAEHWSEIDALRVKADRRNLSV